MGSKGVVALALLLCLISAAVGAWAHPVATKDKDAADDKKFMLVIHARGQSAWHRGRRHDLWRRGTGHVNAT